jgi:cystathionine beta-lyase
MANPLTVLALDQLRERHSVKWRLYPPDVLPLFVAEMDTPLAPPIADALATAVAQGDTGYANGGRLAEAFAGFSADRFGWEPDPARTFLVPGVMGGVGIVLRGLTRPGDGVVINPPVYHPFFSFLPMNGRRVVECPLVDGALDFDRLASCFAEPGVTTYLLCNPHNPTGVVYTRADLETIAELAARHRVRVVADEIHAPLVYPGSAHIPYLSLPGTADAIVLTSASKAWNVPGLTAAVAIGGQTAAAELADLPHEAFFGSGLFGVIAGEAAFRAGGPWLDDLLAGLDANRRLLADLVATHLPGVRYRVPAATYLAWLDFRAFDLPDDPAAIFLDKARVALNSGPMFGTEGTGWARINFATSPEILTTAVTRIAAALSAAAGVPGPSR